MSKKKEENNNESETNANSKLNSFHQDIFKQIDNRLISRGVSEVLESIGANPFNQSISDYSRIINGNAFSQFLSQFHKNIPGSIVNEISSYNNLISKNIFSVMGSVNNSLLNIPVSAFSGISSIFEQVKDSIPSLNAISQNVFSNIEMVQRTIFDDSLVHSFSETYDNFNRNLSHNIFVPISEFIQSSIPYLEDVTTDTYVIEGNSLLIQKEKFEIESLREIIKEIINESGIAKFETEVRDSLKELKNSIIKLTNDKIKMFLLGLFSAIIIQFVFTKYGQDISEFSDSLFKQNSKSAIKKIPKATKELPLDILPLLKNYRFVIKQVLDIRENPKQKSKKVGELYFGQLVLVKKVQKNWTFVQIINEDESESVEGWVFSRYLKKFK